MMTDPLVWTDDQDDAERADDGVSRYGAYLRQRRDQFEGLDLEDPSVRARFAAFAWRTATGPVMAPAYVQMREDLNGIRVVRDDYDDGLWAVQIELNLPRTALKAFGRVAGAVLLDFGDWATSRRWDSDHRAYFEPDYKNPAVLTTTRILIPLDLDRLPLPVRTGRTVPVADAKTAVDIICDIVNHEAGPAVEALRGNL